MDYMEVKLVHVYRPDRRAKWKRESNSIYIKNVGWVLLSDDWVEEERKRGVKVEVRAVGVPKEEFLGLMREKVRELEGKAMKRSLYARLLALLRERFPEVFR